MSLGIRNPERKVLGVSEAAVRLQVSESRVRILIRKGQLPANRLGARAWLIKATDLIAFAKARNAKARRWEKARRQRGDGDGRRKRRKS